MKLCLNSFAHKKALLWPSILLILSNSCVSVAQNTEESKADTEESTEVTPTPEPIPERAETPNNEEQSRLLLSQELSSDNQVKLSAQGEEFLALWEPDTSGNPFGAVIILHNEGENPDWPHTVHDLRKELALHGWSTLAIEMPRADSQPVPNRPTPVPEEVKSPKPDESDNQETEEPPPTPASKPKPTLAPVTQSDKKKTSNEILTSTRLKSAMTYLNEQGQFNIVLIGNGLGAPRAARFANEQTGSMNSNSNKLEKGVQTKGAKVIIQRPIRALVFIGARNEIPESDRDLPSLLNDPQLPVLDIVLREHHLEEQDAEARKKAARKNKMKSYFQVKLLPPKGETEKGENRLVRRVRGFLNRHAKGVEI